ncbi:MAG TPA: hypothetical protein VGK73_06690 [Polyangiaceae bacterium]
MNAATVTPIKPSPDPKLVEALESWLEDAKRGELVGCVLLGNRRGDEIQHQWAGLMPLSMAMLIWEKFKFSLFGG